MADRTGSRVWSRVLSRVDDGLRVLGALVGTFPLSVLVAGAVAAYLPLAPAVRFPLGVMLVIPLWVAAMCAGFLAPRGWQLWLVIALAIAGLSALVPHASLFAG